MKMGVKAGSASREQGNSLRSRYERSSRFLGWRERHDVFSDWRCPEKTIRVMPPGSCRARYLRYSMCQRLYLRFFPRLCDAGTY